MAAVQNLPAQIRALAGKPLSDMAKLLKNSETALLHAASAPNGTATLLSLAASLEISAHTLGIVSMLNAAAAKSDAGLDMATAISAVLQLGDSEQLQFAPAQTATLAGHLRDIMVELQQPRLAIAPLQAAVCKVAGARPLITPMHAMLFQCCLLANNPAAAVPVLERDAHDVDPALTGMTIRDFLLWRYYGGLINIARKRYAEAAEMLLAALTAPSMVTNAIVVAAWKKWALLGLLREGAVPQLPKWTSPAVSRTAKQEGGAYQDLATAYAGKSATVMSETVAKHRAVFAEDENLGLVKLVVEAQTKRNVLRLTQTYITLSLADIASNVGLPTAEAAELAILRMVDAGEVFAEMDGSKGMVRFLEDPQQFRSAATVARLDAHIAAATALGERVAATCAEVSKSKKYLGRLYHRTDLQRYGGGGVPGEEDDEIGPLMPPEPSPPGFMLYQA
eukprot:CAMPEP_0206143158 /NCGR_PEP_ID=MMETSP1473-20131121/19525_1 /ASSEMBLY_ACC=CAM_ASM_001109 /TAXON_ID=1461547 /ORGANISM="Stichococcus sp, Strain RCC1054" /LENGTH=449 /DNA_ID=CAMNT_0053538445 /DNA_START=183 /DNA_END=1532 /DNA_ORIENTATION=+